MDSFDIKWLAWSDPIYAKKRKQYDKYLMDAPIERDVIETAKAEGHMEGYDKGHEEGREEGGKKAERKLQKKLPKTFCQWELLP